MEEMYTIQHKVAHCDEFPSSLSSRHTPDMMQGALSCQGIPETVRCEDYSSAQSRQGNLSDFRHTQNDITSLHSSMEQWKLAAILLALKEPGDPTIEWFSCRPFLCPL